MYHRLWQRGWKTTHHDDQGCNETNNKKTSPSIDHGENSRHPPGLNIAVFHNKCVVVIPPAIRLNGTFRTTITPAYHTSIYTCFPCFIDLRCTPWLQKYYFDWQSRTNSNKIQNTESIFFQIDNWGLPQPAILNWTLVFQDLPQTRESFQRLRLFLTWNIYHKF